MALQEAKRKAREEAAKLADAQERARLAALPEEPTCVSYRVLSSLQCRDACHIVSGRVLACRALRFGTRK